MRAYNYNCPFLLVGCIYNIMKIRVFMKLETLQEYQPEYHHRL
jgi:hypothetical protein